MFGLKTHRWNRIFAADGKALIVAMDHPGTFGMMEGMEDPGRVLREIGAAGADAVLTTYGVVSKFAEDFGNMGIVLRVDGGTSFLAEERSYSRLIYHIPDALRIGADAVGCMGMPGSVFEDKTLPYLPELVTEATEWNVPVMVEALPGGFESPQTWWTPENIGHACRICAEMGADFIKTTYTGDVESFRKIVEQLYVPVVVLGGSKSKDPRDLLSSVKGAMEAGASGVAMGRNIWRHPSPGKMTAAVGAIIHEGASVEQALKHLQ
ncbi:MAG: class I fructose-bisphosphate aldolase [Anaerolineae bacterium]